jgi:hypothetical protein
VAAGLAVRESRDAIWAALDTVDTVTAPNNHRHALYNEARARRGLEPIRR